MFFDMCFHIKNKKDLIHHRQILYLYLHIFLMSRSTEILLESNLCLEGIINMMKFHGQCFQLFQSRLELFRGIT